MGVLALLHYPTELFLKAADHTYVECNSGAVGWRCWGGKTGGALLRHAPGSTKRADDIAEPDEKAGVQCYLVNGVCHQASNRILLAAGITADGVRGYTLSTAIFGPYGRQSAALGLCKAPLLPHSGTTGDVPLCMTQPSANPLPGPPDDTGSKDFQDAHYMSAVRDLYQTYFDSELSVAAGFEFQMALFRALVAHRVRRRGRRLAPHIYERVMVAREDFERNRLDAEKDLFAQGHRLEFCAEFDALTVKFQDDLAQVLDSEEYLALLALEPAERILVSDPAVVRATYESTPRPRGSEF